MTAGSNAGRGRKWTGYLRGPPGPAPKACGLSTSPTTGAVSLAPLGGWFFCPESV